MEHFGAIEGYESAVLDATRWLESAIKHSCFANEDLVDAFYAGLSRVTLMRGEAAITHVAFVESKADEVLSQLTFVRRHTSGAPN